MVEISVVELEIVFLLRLSLNIIIINIKIKIKKKDCTKFNTKSQRFHVSLKNLPLLDPSMVSPVYEDKFETQQSCRNEPIVARLTSKEGTELVQFDQVTPKTADMADRNFKLDFVVEEHVCSSSTKLLDPNSTNDFDFNFNRENQICHSNSKVVQDAVKKASPKSQLHEICAANKWKFPLYECCKEEGPSHVKLFTYKVVVEIHVAPTTILECFSKPQSKKKTAADHAAEGALWYLRHLVYF